MLRLEDLLHPLSLSEFFETYWGKRPCFVQGDRDRLSGLMNWHALNQLLIYNRLDFPRIRLAKKGETGLASNAKFVNYQPQTLGPPLPKIDFSKLNELLLDGSTLVVDAVDQALPSVQELTRGLEREISEYVHANAYASFKSISGFGLHRDNHEVFILQLEGTKSWTVFSGQPSKPKIEDTPLWEGIVSPGGFLYVPSGFWHDAVTHEEPSLHITLSAYRRTSQDFLNWICTRRLTKPSDYVPTNCNSERKREYLDQLKTELNSLLMESLLEEFLINENAEAKSSNASSLPFIHPKRNLFDAGVRIRCLLPRRIKFSVSNDGIEFVGLGKPWRFERNASAAIELVLGGEWIFASDFLTEFLGGNEEAEALLRQLIVDGLVEVS